MNPIMAAKKSTSVHIRLQPALLRNIGRAAGLDRRSISDWIRIALHEEVQRRLDENKGAHRTV